MLAPERLGRVPNSRSGVRPVARGYLIARAATRERRSASWSAVMMADRLDLESERIAPKRGEVRLRILGELLRRMHVNTRQAIRARHPERTWDRRYPLTVLADNGIIEISGTTARFVEDLDFIRSPPCCQPSTSVLSEPRDSASRTLRGVLINVSGRRSGGELLKETANAAPSSAAIAPKPSS
jgi:hypothetical protein